MTIRMNAVAASVAMACALAAAPASAVDVTLYNLDASSVAAFGEPNYGTVSLSQNVGSVGFLIELRSDLNLVFTGDPGSKAVFAFNAQGVTAADIGNIIDKAGKTFAVEQPGINSPFGQFTFGIICTSDCPHTGFGDLLAFTVANATIGDFNGASTGGSPNALFAVNVFMTGSGVAGTVAAIPIATPVPEPDTSALMLAGLGAVGLVARRHRAAAPSFRPPAA